mmetsp:Transcript_12148/g.28082  ORF Transcript_12148/g.28082 Transcript_12148/m.28082 type:complete len:247 (-) Transcript_12148:961-1701(-)
MQNRCDFCVVGAPCLLLQLECALEHRLCLLEPFKRAEGKREPIEGCSKPRVFVPVHSVIKADQFLRGCGHLCEVLRRLVHHQQHVQRLREARLVTLTGRLLLFQNLEQHLLRRNRVVRCDVLQGFALQRRHALWVSVPVARLPSVTVPVPAISLAASTVAVAMTAVTPPVPAAPSARAGRSTVAVTRLSIVGVPVCRRLLRLLRFAVAVAGLAAVGVAVGGCSGLAVPVTGLASVGVSVAAATGTA